MIHGKSAALSRVRIKVRLPAQALRLRSAQARQQGTPSETGQGPAPARARPEGMLQLVPTLQQLGSLRLRPEKPAAVLRA